MPEAPIDFLVEKVALTKTLHRDVYPMIDPSNQDFEGKNVVLITGAGRGLGQVSRLS
jgi:hypothetical protein